MDFINLLSVHQHSSPPIEPVLKHMIEQNEPWTYIGQHLMRYCIVGPWMNMIFPIVVKSLLGLIYDEKPIVGMHTEVMILTIICISHPSYMLLYLTWQIHSMNPWGMLSFLHKGHHLNTSQVIIERIEQLNSDTVSFQTIITFNGIGSEFLTCFSLHNQKGTAFWE